MKLLDSIRSKSRLKSQNHAISALNSIFDNSSFLDIPFLPNPTSKFSIELLIELFSYVCPHSQDSSCTTCEESMIDAGCMLCDMRDLAQCALVNRQWSDAALSLL